ncbi:MAG: AAA family ATPase [Phycisphaerales bacterium]
MSEPGCEVVLTSLDGVETREVQWLWPLRVPLGKFTLFQGDPCVGKSFVTMDMAARVSTGRAWPDCPAQVNPIGMVVLLSAEDDAADTIKPRLLALDGDPKRVHILEGVRRRIDERPDQFSLEGDVARLGRALEQLREARLIVIDPISAYLGSVDSHTNADVRRVLAPLADLAGRANVAIVGVTHLNKSGGTKAIYRSTGSLAFVAAARASWCFQKDPDDPDRRLMLPIKNNLARECTGLAYRIVGDDPPRLEWDTEPVTITADEAFASEGVTGDDRNRIEAAAEWLDAQLRLGPMLADDVIRQGKEAGHTERTLNRAKKRVGIKSRKDGFQGQSVWVHPAAQTVPTFPISASPAKVALIGEVGTH